MGGYYTFAEIEQHLDELYVDYPEIITEKVFIGSDPWKEGISGWLK